MREPTEREARLLDSAVVTGGLGPRYSQPHRKYHNLMHIEDVLLRIEELEPPVEHELTLALAAWFHDAVYQPGKDDNEDRSAYVAYDALEQIGASPDLIAEVVRLVRLTAHHDPADDDAAGAVLCDADLAILAAAPDRYREYATAIRQEYVHVPEAEFRSGRAAVLRRFLDRPTIYRTPYGREHWEDAARANIAAEIEALESGGG
jgi:predicted metal-dependent HD superfamily phosphohydrolase